MQLELLELTIVGLVLLPNVVLAILFLLDFQKSEGREKITAIYGFLTFILMFMYFLVNWLLPLFVTVDIAIIIILFGCAITFIPVWVVSLTKPDLLESWKIPFAIIFLAIWAVYTIPRVFMATNLSIYFLAVVFVISIIFLLLGVMEDIKLILLVLALAFIYLERSWTLFDPLIEYAILIVGIWLIVIWYLLNRRSS
jgi:hypothetical protein